ncbi:MAG: hypothetical protein Q4A96_04315 [Candidatus Saccharibacteria bacterium]|nr:hypothetical protein [Candidatus Saccharibacteria bacterium]
MPNKENQDKAAEGAEEELEKVLASEEAENSEDSEELHACGE